METAASSKPAQRHRPTRRAAMLVGVLASESPAGGTCPVATVVISGGGASEQTVESPEVKASVGWGSLVSSDKGGEQIDRS
jgi:hypothetical protein